MRKKETTEDPIAESPPSNKGTFVLTPEVENVSITHELLKEITEYSKEAFPKEAIGLLDGKMEKPGEIVINKIFLSPLVKNILLHFQMRISRYSKIQSFVLVGGILIQVLDYFYLKRILKLTYFHSKLHNLIQ